MEEIKLNWWTPLIKGIAFFALGVFVINQPDESMMAILKTMGIAMILIGAALATFSYYTRKNLSGYTNYLIMGVVFIALGLYLVFKPDNSGRILAIAFALAIGFSGVVNFAVSLNLKRYQSPYWLWTMVTAIFELIIAIIFLLDPKIAGLTIITVLGVGMIIFGLLNVMISVNLKRSMNFINQQNHNE